MKDKKRRERKKGKKKQTRSVGEENTPNAKIFTYQKKKIKTH